MNNKLSAIILAKNEEKQIETCLKSLEFCDEIIVVDSGSTDKTLSLAKKYTNQIYQVPFTNFSDLRNLGKEKAKNGWILYVDADEEVTTPLKEEINDTIRQSTDTSEVAGGTPRRWSDQKSAYYVVRSNFYLSKEWPTKDKVERLFKRENLSGWYGEVHESPKIEGEKGELKNEIIHRTHNSLEEMLNNTIAWSDFEAKARFAVNHPPVTWWRIFRMMATSFWDYYIKQKGWKLGTVGLIESIYQSFSIFVTYAKLWEMQNNISI
ncbi:glycosyltransferase family 2 protein [Candidatus Roizmanbacteria bacterium]|nr:glycosyltransferase family 2 protein [Candidatus Roizmanbacteria bacterium]